MAAMSDPIADLLAAQAKSAAAADPISALLAVQAKGAAGGKSTPVDPTDGMSTTEKFLAGAGKAFYDVGRGTGQLARHAIEAVAPPQRNVADLVAGRAGTSLADRLGLPTQADIDEGKR